MSKTPNTFDLALPPRASGLPAYRWLYNCLRAQILAGRLRSGQRLPATRDLARQHGLSRGTVVNAFEQLRSEGYVEGRVGSGTYVSATLPEARLRVAPGASGSAATRPHSSPSLSEHGKRAKLFAGYEDRPIRAFRANLPALDLFPAEVWAQIASRRLRGVSAKLLMGCEPFGYVPLRKAIAGYLATSRGVNCVAEQVAIVSGVQEGLDLTARLFLNPGDRVCMENPGYPGAAMVFAAFGAKVCNLSLDGEGVRVDMLPARDVRLVYVTPGHQFPVGTTMSVGRRLQLLKWARKSRALIFEDDYDSEYRYSGRPIPALQGLDGHAPVLYAGSFSKVLFPALRLGYLVIPPHLVNRYEAIKSLSSRHASLVDQMVLSEFITEGHFGRHLRRMRVIYAERLSVLLEEAAQTLSGLLEISTVEAGLQTTGWLCEGVDGESAAGAASKRNVEVVPLSRYAKGTLAREGLQLGFAALDVREIKRGVEDLAIAIESELRARR